MKSKKAEISQIDAGDGTLTSALRPILLIAEPGEVSLLQMCNNGGQRTISRLDMCRRDLQILRLKQVKT
jgi:hypothetical protein